MKIDDKYLDWVSIVFMALVALVTVLVIVLTGKPAPAGVTEMTFTQEELALIDGADGTMRVLTVADSLDLKVLRAKSVDFSAADLASKAFSRLSELMIATVTSPEQDGVGISAPQVGLNRRVVAVQRFDKEGAPFEVYPNIQVDSLYGEPVPGQEGCLSVPGLRGKVMRCHNIIVSYTDPLTLTQVRDTISGFTAVIFQHETDHLEGILYTDKATDIVPR